jgi:hypothetical protein
MRKFKLWGLSWLCLCFISCTVARKMPPNGLNINILVVAGRYDLTTLPFMPYAVQNVTDENGEVKVSLSFHLRDARQLDLLVKEIDHQQLMGIP